MARRYTPTVTETIAYCLKRLADPNTHPIDREVIRRKLDALGPRCVACGRAIENEDSLEAWEKDGLGSSCRAKAVA